MIVYHGSTLIIQHPDVIHSTDNSHLNTIGKHFREGSYIEVET